MDLVTEKLLLTVFGTGVGYALKFGIDKAGDNLWRLKALRKFWHFLETPTVVFVPTKPAAVGEFGPAVGYGDGLALAELQTLGKRLFPKMPELKITSDYNQIDNLQDTSIVILGGGKYNHAYLNLVEKLRPAVHFFDTAVEDFKVIRNATRTLTFSPQLEDGRLQSDLGLILRSRRVNSAREVLILAGSYTYGTWGAMKYLSIARNVRPTLKLLETGFELVIRCRMDGNNITSTVAESTLRRFGNGCAV